MRVLQVINTLDTGGAEKLLLDTIPLLRTNGIQVDVLVFEGMDGFYLTKLQNLNCCNIYSLNSKSLYSPFNIFKIIPYLKNYELIHVHLFPAHYWVVLAKILSFSKINLIFTEHSTFNRRRNIFLLKYLDKFIYNKYAKIVCISDAVKNELINVFNIPLYKLITIENGIYLNRFENAISYSKSDVNQSITENDRLLIQVSKFRVEKDQITVIKAMQFLPVDHKLILVGDGPLRTVCENLVDKLDLTNRVFFLKSRNDTERLLKTCDLSIISSHWEGFGLVAVEGMAVGRPVIASNVSGLRDVVINAGLLFEKGNEIELAETIKMLLAKENQNLYNEISHKCLLRARIYDINMMVNKSIKLYKNLLN